MPNYRRPQNGNVFFFTVVTYQRLPFLCLPECRKIFREVILNIRERYPFIITAWVLLPEHTHCLWELPDDDINFSRRWSLIKKDFTKRAGELVRTAHPTESRLNRREGTIWQRRFWEHKIRDENDLKTHCDYIHYNPVKHGLVARPAQWEFSTFHDYVTQGVYPDDWGSCPIDLPEQVGQE